MVLPVRGNFLKVEACAPNVIRVACAPRRSFFSRRSLIVLPQRNRPKCRVTRTAGEMFLTTSQLQVRVDSNTGAIKFLDTLIA